MDNLEQLVKQYKKTKDSNILNKIFICLNPILKKKADYLYYKKEYVKKMKWKQKYDYVEKKIKDLPTPEKFNLSDINILNSDDIYQELCILVLKIIKDYDTKSAFKPYLFSSLWKWRPYFVHTKKFKKELDTIRDSSIDDSKGTLFDFISIATTEPVDEEEILKCFENLTAQEEELIKLILHNSDMTQKKLAKYFHVTQQAISLRLRKLRKKYKNYL